MKNERTHEAVPDADIHQRQVVLLRVGIDTGCGGMLGPIFADGSFEFVPINSGRDRLQRTYGNTQGRHGRRLIEYFPDGLKRKMKDSFLHFDPEFDTFTYGDPTLPKQVLKKLRHGDLLVFYAGLKGWDGCANPPGLYIIGFFVVQHAGTYADLKRTGALGQFAKNWHVLNGDAARRTIGGKRTRWIDLVLVKGGHGSRLLKKAVKISADKKGTDRGGHPVFVFDPKMKKHFGSFTKLNAIQRCTPRWVKLDMFRRQAAAFVMGLK